MEPFDLAQLLLGMGEQVDALAAQRVREQHFGSEARHGNGGVFEESDALEEGGL